MTTQNAAELCRALGDENRLKIIDLLTQGEQCACRLLEKFNITQPTLSHHIKILSECGLVKSRRDGKWTHYSINCETFREFKRYFEAVECCGNSDCRCGD
ncbi:MAG: ArsR/SmtB family transcription factor [Treponema sp.]